MSEAVPETEGALSAAEATFERWRRVSGAVAAPMAAVVTWLLVPAALPPEGRRLAAILAASAILWMTETLPLPVTALLAAVLCIVFQVAEPKVVLAPFADPIIFLFLGSFMLARAMALHGLDKRIALAFLSNRWIGASPARMLAGLGLITALISMWVSNTATTAMMLPIGVGILHATWEARFTGGNEKIPMSAANWPFATAMMLMIAYAASIGGIGTPVGSPPNLIGLAQIQAGTGIRISFFKWMMLAVPMLAVMGAALFVILFALHPFERGAKQRLAPDAIRLYIRREREALGPWTVGQANTVIAFAVAVVMWVTPGFMAAYLGDKHPAVAHYNRVIPEAVAALSAALLLFVLPISLRRGEFTLTWENAVRIDWGTILLFGGGLCLGGLMERTGVSAAMGTALKNATGGSSIWTLTAVAIVVGIILSETTSNTAAATVLVPVIVASAKAAGVSAVPPALGAVLGASYGFMLPVSTPPNAIVYGSGLVPIPRMVKAGVIFDLVGGCIIWLGLRALCPLLGLD